MKTNQHGEIQPEIRTMYNYDRDAISDMTATTCEPETRTQQQFKDECDINIIMERFGVTGEMPTNIRPVLGDDYDEVFDFQTAMNIVRKAEEAFMEMPAGVRARFNNNPGIFAQYFENEDNRLEAEKLGLVLPRPKEEPKEAQKGDGVT